jgi:hypothetical protein
LEYRRGNSAANYSALDLAGDFQTLLKSAMTLGTFESPVMFSQTCS